MRRMVTPAPEPVTPFPPRGVRLPVLRQHWTDAVFLHWEIDPAAARPHLPPGTDVDVVDGRTYVGLVGITMRVAGPIGPALPWVGRFVQVNVRLYTVDAAGRRGVAFRSLDAPRLLPAAAGRCAWGLPYVWCRGGGGRRGDVVTYAVRRRGAVGTGTRFAVRVGERVEPTALVHWLTARWALHWAAWGRTWWEPLAHDPWVLHRAEVVHLEDSLVAAAGLPPPAGPPVSVRYAAAARSAVGIPRPVRAGNPGRAP